MRDPASSAEVVVVGGGPAGCAVAIRLAQLGHDVLLVDRGGRGRPAAVESAPSSLLVPLQALGLDHEVERLGFLRSPGTWLRWDGRARLVDSQGSGFQVERERFDALMQHAARRAGVRFVRAHAHAPRRLPDGHWTLSLDDGRCLRTPAMALASGRAGAVMPGAVATAALCGLWPAQGAAPMGTAPGSSDPHARVQAAPGAWAWAAPRADGQVAAALFVDARRLAGLDDDARRALLAGELARCELLAPWIAGAGPARLRVTDATPRMATQPIEPGLVRVGEAAASLDPLSSQGLVAALRSGLQAAASLHTTLWRPADAALAAQFHAQQTHGVALRHARWCAGFHQAAADHFGTAFWCQRAKTAAEAGWLGEHAGGADPGEGSWPTLDTPVTLDSRATFGSTAMLDGDWVIAAPALRHPRLESPVGYVQGQPVAVVLDALRPAVRTGALLTRWAALIGDQAAVTLLRGWWRQGVLVEGVAEPTPASSA